MKPVIMRNFTLSSPILQGGMGVGVSLGGLAGAVAKCGGMGVISAALPGYLKENYAKNPVVCDREAIIEEIAKAKQLAQGAGAVGINVMVAMKHYAESVQAAVQGGVDAIISGAGLPLDLPKFTAGTNIAIAPIVSSARAALLICKRWDKTYGVTPDFIVVEGPQAGGHLGYDAAAIQDGTAQTPAQIIPELRRVLVAFEEKYQRRIPVFAAGGVFDGADCKRMIDCGADGVQIGTRFIATEECDASQGFKDVILAAKAEDAVLLKSPVGMPGRAVQSPLLARVAIARQQPKRCVDCLAPCNPATTSFCISGALAEAAKGNVEDGLFFCGSNVGRINQMTTVPALMAQIQQEWREAEQSAVSL